MKEKLIGIFERANEIFLRENKSFIVSDVAERSLCSTLAQCIYLEISNSIFENYYAKKG